MKPSPNVLSRISRPSLLTIFTVAATISFNNTAFAASNSWVAAGNGNYSDPTKWTGGVNVPNGAADAASSDGTGSIIAFGAADTVTLSALNLNLTSGATIFNQGGGSLSVGTLAMGGGGGSRKPIYNLSAGTLNISSAFTWGSGTTTAFNQSGGTTNYTSASNISMGAADGAVSTIKLTGGIFNANSAANIYLGNGGAGKGLLDLSNDSQFNSTSATLVLGQSGTAGSQGTLTMAGTSALQSANIILGGANSAFPTFGVVNLNGGTISTGSIRKGTSSIAASSTANVFNADGGTVKAVTSANNANFFAGAFVNIKAGGLTFDTNGNSVGISNIMSGAGGLTKSNTAGTLTLSGVNTYAGGTTVDGGTLVLATGGGDGAIRGALTINSGASVGLTTANALGFNGGTKVNSIAVNGGTLSAASGAGDQGWGIAYTLNEGLIQSNGGVSDPTATSNLTLDSNSSVSTLAGAASSTIAGRVILRGDNGGNVNFTVADGTAGIDLLVSAAVTNKVTFPAAGFTKLGNGVMNLTGSSTYTGATVVSAGTLLVNGSLGNTSVSVTAASGTATLGGAGTIGDVAGVNTVTVGGNGVLAPGNSPGALVINGSNTINGGTYAYQYTGAADLGGAADLVEVNGTLTLTNATLTLEDLGAYTLGNKFTLFAYDAISGTFNGLDDDSIFSANGGNWFINYNDDTQGVNGGTGAAYVTLTAVPEPSAAFLGLLGTLSLLRRRR